MLVWHVMCCSIQYVFGGGFVENTKIFNNNEGKYFFPPFLRKIMEPVDSGFFWNKCEINSTFAFIYWKKIKDFVRVIDEEPKWSCSSDWSFSKTNNGPNNLIFIHSGRKCTLFLWLRDFFWREKKSFRKR